MTKVASYLSRKIGRSTHLYDIGGVKPIQQYWSSGKLSDSRGELAIRQLQPEDQELALDLAGRSSGAQMQQIKPHD